MASSTQLASAFQWLIRPEIVQSLEVPYESIRKVTIQSLAVLSKFEIDGIDGSVVRAAPMWQVGLTVDLGDDVPRYRNFDLQGVEWDTHFAGLAREAINTLAEDQK